MSTNPPKILTQARLKELLHYDPDTGIFTWIVHRGGTRRVGSVAGSIGRDGYIVIRVDRKIYPAHRLASLYVTGEFPSADTDHINGVRDDNRFLNLRNVSRSENHHNLGGPLSNNTSGFLGVWLDKALQKWRACIWVDGVRIYLGSHATPELAHAAYLKAKDELHPTHRRLRAA